MDPAESDARATGVFFPIFLVSPLTVPSTPLTMNSGLVFDESFKRVLARPNLPLIPGVKPW
jgi:hypothetical protein